jgi:serine/threonine protein kinase
MDLEKFISQTPSISETFALRLFFQVLQGVRILHQQQISHRDLKPANLLY